MKRITTRWDREYVDASVDEANHTVYYNNVPAAFRDYVWRMGEEEDLLPAFLGSLHDFLHMAAAGGAVHPTLLLNALEQRVRGYEHLSIRDISQELIRLAGLETPEAWDTTFPCMGVSVTACAGDLLHMAYNSCADTIITWQGCAPYTVEMCKDGQDLSAYRLQGLISLCEKGE